MKNIMKRGIALLMALVLCLSLLPVLQLHAQAADFSYTYDSTGKYIYNWGERGETATELSPNAKNFYVGLSSYSILIACAGGTGASDAPSSQLYIALQKVMKDAHTHQTSYEETKNLYKYTDCQNGGGKISSFYSGVEIGPNWGSSPSWNREHTWPNSKGAAGSDENDIMMLRPTASSENSSRGNKAYGKSSGYYNPNSASGNTLDLRGDVARIFLYTYVRWGITNGNGDYSTWGSNGVMESVEVLLEWIEADPVDTWELGRNDAVQAITGTRNVFVDYPELAFRLFGENIPADLVTPSGGAATDCGHNNWDAGVITAVTCTSNGYTTFTCKTAGCGYTYKSNIVVATGHNYVDGACSECGAKNGIADVTAPETGKAYKLGLFKTSGNKAYYFSGTMNGYYGVTDQNIQNGVDVYLESAGSGYHLYFINSSGAKQYINLVASGTHRNFTFGTEAVTVFSWDADKDTLYTTIQQEACYMGNYGEYTSMGGLQSSRLQDSDSLARLYQSATVANQEYTVRFVVPTGVAAISAMRCGASGITLPVAQAPQGYTFVGWSTNTFAATTDVPTYLKGSTAYRANQDVVLYAVYTYQQQGTITGNKTATILFNTTDNRTVFNTKQQVWQSNGITVTNDKGASTSNVADYFNPARFYKSSKLTIAYNGMTKMEFVCGSNDYAQALVGSVTGATATANGKNVTIVLNAATNEFVIEKLSAQVRVASITVSAPGSSQTGTVTYYTTTIGNNSCAHTDTYVSGAEEATCTAPGYTGDLKCRNCQATLSYGEEITASHSIQHVDAKAATVDAAGNIEYWYCSVCEKAWKDEACTVSVTLEETVLPKLDAPKDNPTDNTDPTTGEDNTDPTGGDENTEPSETRPTTGNQNSDSDNDTNNNWIVILIVVVVAAAAVIIIVIKKKKPNA